MAKNQDMREEEPEQQQPSKSPLSHLIPPPLVLDAPLTKLPKATGMLYEVIEPKVTPALAEGRNPSTKSTSSPEPSSRISEKTTVGPYTPNLIIHGGSGAITRTSLPPTLYAQYRSSLLKYLESTHAKLKSGTSALDAACHAVSLMEDDPLFNCGRGSVFTEKGTIEMEASVMVSSVRGDDDDCDSAFPPTDIPSVPVKRGASVSLIKSTRHPILLAREVLLAGGDGLGGVGTMHCQLAGQDVEEWGWKEKGLERKEPNWFWTKKRWREHLRHQEELTTAPCHRLPARAFDEADDLDPPTQGTVGAVCMDSWGNLAVATSTGGLTNKKAGRIGDTPTIGAGFWAESWDEHSVQKTDIAPKMSTFQADGRRLNLLDRIARATEAGFGDVLRDCLPISLNSDHDRRQIFPKDKADRVQLIEEDQPTPVPQMSLSNAMQDKFSKAPSIRRRGVAMSGTGNGDSFLRTSAVRTTAAICRFGSHPLNSITLAKAVTLVAGPDGEIQCSAGNRWQKTFEGQGGIIGIELYHDEKKGKVVFDFNCSGLWRAWLEEGTGKARVMVFKDEYQA